MIQRSLSQVLRSLQPIKRSDNVYSVAGSDRINAIQDAVRLLARGDNIVSGQGFRHTRGDGYVVLKSSSSRPRASTTDFPWKITAEGNDQEGWWVNVAPGTITNLMASNALEKIYIDNSQDSKWFIKIGVNTNGMIPTFVTLYADLVSIDNSANATQNTAPPDFNVIIGMVNKLDVYQVVYDNLVATPDIAFLESRTPPGPGEEPYLRWWYWKVESA